MKFAGSAALNRQPGKLSQPNNYKPNQRVTRLSSKLWLRPKLILIMIMVLITDRIEIINCSNSKRSSFPFGYQKVVRLGWRPFAPISNHFFQKKSRFSLAVCLHAIENRPTTFLTKLVYTAISVRRCIFGAICQARTCRLPPLPIRIVRTLLFRSACLHEVPYPPSTSGMLFRSG